MTDLSEQQLVSCDTSNKGCNGGWYTGAFKHLIDNGVFDEAAYPYKGIASECQSSKLTPLSHKVASYSQKWGSDYQLFKALEQGPAAVAVDAGKLQFYASGLFYPTSASTTVQNMANALNTTCTTRGTFASIFGHMLLFILRVVLLLTSECISHKSVIIRLLMSRFFFFLLLLYALLCTHSLSRCAPCRQRQARYW